MNVQGFSHVTINVKDLARSLRFYVDILNMKLVIVDERMHI
jgi:catechol 2,3-dioxygenase-like lactoylglutathione lyase family enzyme